MASESPNCSSSSNGIDELEELEATEIDESLMRDLLEELEEDEEVKNDQTSCTCAVQTTEATAIGFVHPGMLGCDEFSEHTTGSHVHDTLWLDIMEMDPPSPMMNELTMMVWHGESCVEEEIGGGMVDFGRNGTDEPHFQTNKTRAFLFSTSDEISDRRFLREGERSSHTSSTLLPCQFQR